MADFLIQIKWIWLRLFYSDELKMSVTIWFRWNKSDWDFLIQIKWKCPGLFGSDHIEMTETFWPFGLKNILDMFLKSVEWCWFIRHKMYLVIPTCHWCWKFTVWVITLSETFFQLPLYLKLMFLQFIYTTAQNKN